MPNKVFFVAICAAVFPGSSAVPANSEVQGEQGTKTFHQIPFSLDINYLVTQQLFRCAALSMKRWRMN